MLEKLSAMLSDSNPAVVANAVAALCEVQESTDKRIFKARSTCPDIHPPVNIIQKSDLICILVSSLS